MRNDVLILMSRARVPWACSLNKATEAELNQGIPIVDTLEQIKICLNCPLPESKCKGERYCKVLNGTGDKPKKKYNTKPYHFEAIEGLIKRGATKKQIMKELTFAL
jgi:hypothetical protein